MKEGFPSNNVLSFGYLRESLARTICNKTKTIMGIKLKKTLLSYCSIDIAASSAIKIDTIKSTILNSPTSLFSHKTI